MTSSSEPMPADQATRDRIAGALTETLFVEAGAGTGKTTALVERVLGLVEAGVPVTSIAAITFTEAAAAELRDRIRGRLEERVAAAAPQHARCRAALDALDAAAIQTLHAFARRILAMHPIEAGLPPAFEVRDDIAADIAFEDLWTSFVTNLFNTEEHAPHLTRSLALGLGSEHLRNIARALHANWDRLVHEPLRNSPPMPIEGEAERILEPLRAALGLRDACNTPDDRLLEHLNGLSPWLDAAESADERLADASGAVAIGVAEQEMLSLLASAPKFSAGRLGRKDAWGDTKQDVHNCLAQALVARQTLLDALRRDCIEYLRPLLVAWVLAYADQRHGDGSLEQHDLLVHAARLLRASAHVRARLHQQFTHLLVDEFQDTDPLQVEIATLIATSAADVEGRAWRKLPVEPGRLFFVGDPRQSIYRFRRADIELYGAARDAFVRAPEHLTANFRSRPNLIEWTNHLFGRVFETAYGGASNAPRQAAYTPLNAYRVSIGTHVHVIGGPVQGQNERGGGEEEAGRVAGGVRQARDEDWLENGATRFADITILLPTRAPLRAFERALGAHGIPFRVEGATLLFGTQEIRDFTNVLAAIDDPSDEVSVVAALRSPAFACADDELYAFRQLRPRRTWDYLSAARAPGVPPDHPVLAAMLSLAELHEAATWRSVPELVECIIGDRRLFELAFASSRPRDTWQRLRFLQEKARELVQAGNPSLRQFVAWLRRQAESQSPRFTETAVPDPDDDAVRIMTVHAAKGLEFPIVFVAGLGGRPNEIPPPVLFPASSGGTSLPELNAGRKNNNEEAYFRTSGFAALWQREQLMERLERDRLLYVAATRARDCLVVSAYHKPDHGGHAANHIQAKCRLAECLFSLCEEEPVLRGTPLAERTVPAPSPVPAGEQPDLDAREEWLRRRSEIIAATQRPSALAATAIAHAGEERPEPTDDEAPWRRGRAGTAVGRAVHAVLQTIDLATLGHLHDLARAQAAAEGIPGHEAEIARRVRSAAESGPVLEALRGGRYWRELYIVTPVPAGAREMLVEGFIDLLFETGQGYVVADYKTDGVSNLAEAETAMERYQLQGAAYALALQEQGVGPVVRFDCIFARDGGPAWVVSVGGDRLAQAVRHVRERIRAIAAGDLTPA